MTRKRASKRKILRVFKEGDVWVVKQNHFWPDYKSVADPIEGTAGGLRMRFNHRGGKGVWAFPEADAEQMARFCRALDIRLPAGVELEASKLKLGLMEHPASKLKLPPPKPTKEATLGPAIATAKAEIERWEKIQGEAEATAQDARSNVEKWTELLEGLRELRGILVRTKT